MGAGPGVHTAHLHLGCPAHSHPAAPPSPSIPLSSLFFLSSLISSVSPSLLLLCSLSHFFLFFLSILWLFYSHSLYTFLLYSPSCAKNFPPAASRQSWRRKLNFSFVFPSSCLCTQESGTHNPLFVTRDRTHLEVQVLFCCVP